MFPQLRRLKANATRGPGELGGDAQLAVGAPGFVDQVDDHLTGLDFGVLHDFGEVADRFAAAIPGGEMLDPFGLGFLLEKVGDFLL